MDQFDKYHSLLHYLSLINIERGKKFAVSTKKRKHEDIYRFRKANINKYDHKKARKIKKNPEQNEEKKLEKYLLFHEKFI